MIVPIINEVEREVVIAKLDMVKKVTNRVQMDVEDGLFVDRLTTFPGDLIDYDFGELSVEYQLMVDDPTEWIEECIEGHAKKVIGQIERMGSQALFIEEVEQHENVEAGLGLEYTTPVSAIELEALEKAKTILLLAVKTGPSGSKFEEGIIEKIKELRTKYKGTIFIDGGINPETYKKVREAGADEAGSSSYLWSGDFMKNWEEIGK